MFQEALQFQSTIVLCYNKQIVMKITCQIPNNLLKFLERDIDLEEECEEFEGEFEKDEVVEV